MFLCGFFGYIYPTLIARFFCGFKCFIYFVPLFIDEIVKFGRNFAIHATKIAAIFYFFTTLAQALQLRSQAFRERVAPASTAAPLISILPSNMALISSGWPTRTRPWLQRMVA
jgi:hypothetical protein